MEVIIMIIGLVTIINFFLFNKVIKKGNIEVRNRDIYFTYLFISIFQALIIAFLAFSFINIYASIALSMLLYFNLIYAAFSALFRNMENKKDLATILTIKFLKYLIIFEGSIALLIGAFYVFSLLISKM